MNKTEYLKKINNKLVDKDGRLISFEKQIIKAISGSLESNDPLILQENSKCFSFVPKINQELAITMRLDTFAKLATTHEISLDNISEITNLIENCCFAMDSRTKDGSVVIITNKLKEETNSPYLIVCRYDKKIGTYNVNEITSMYEKEKFVQLLNETWNDDLFFYKNKKIESFASPIRLQLPENLSSALSDTYNRKIFNKSQVEKDIQNEDGMEK